MLTTEEYWSVIPADGVEYELQTLAYNIETWGGDREAPPAFRGEDYKVPWRYGEAESTRIVDARTMSLGMWVRGSTPDGGVPDGSSQRQEFVQNWRTLRRILWNKGKVFTLRKRFYDEGYTLRTADARARFDGELNPAMLGRTGAKFTIDLRMADPFFYGDPVSIPFDTTTASVWNGTIIGDFETRKISVSGSGFGDDALDTPSITVPSMTPIHSLSLNGVFAQGAQMSIDVANQQARLDDVSISGLVSHEGSSEWLLVNTGPATIQFDSAVGDWSGMITYYPAWM